MHTLASFYSLETKMKEKLMLPLSKIVVEIYVKFPLVSTIFFFFQSLNYFTHRGNCD